MQTTFRSTLTFLVLVLATGSAAADDARDIMIKVDDVTNHAYSSAVRRSKFSTCRYDIRGGKLSCTEKPQIIVFESFSKSVPVQGSRDSDTRTLDVIVHPESDKGTAMLSWAYGNDDRNSDVWIYLPALDKVKRIVLASDLSEMFGSEVSAEDAGVKKVDHYTYKLLGEDVILGRSTWKIEMTPIGRWRSLSFYGKIIADVDKERFIVLKEDLYDRSGRHHKQLSVLAVKAFGDAWLVTRASMDNLTERRISVWEQLNVALDVPIDDEFLTQRPLTDAEYLERGMTEYRSHLTGAPAKP